MNRRATPDSEAVASSEDDVPWPHSTFGSLPRKENGVPGFGGGIWAQSSRGSFKLDQEARRNATRQAHMGVPISSHAPSRSIDTPSPTYGEGNKVLPFSIPLRPTAKPGRSLSHSQGQREMPQLHHTQAGATERGPVLPLGLVNEADEGDTESEAELGVPLTQTTSHPTAALYNRMPTFPSHLQHAPAPVLERARTDTFDEATHFDHLGTALEGLRLDGIQRNKQRWQTSSNWDELHTINESRRHSLAGELPTRRGSMAEIHDASHADRHGFANQHGFQEGSKSFNIPELYRVPQVTLDAHERASLQHNIAQPSSRPRKELYIVSFKCSRAGVFYLLDNTGLTVEEGNMVIVEADRGQDLGTVQHAQVSPEEARALLAKYSEEQYKWLMMFSRNNQAGAVNPNAAVYGESNTQTSASRPNMPSSRPSRDQFANLKPKAIKRMAAPHEIRMLKDKEGNEAKAKRCCQQKVFQHHLDMEILESEFQWDWQKLIFYYYADHYVNFKELVNDLYKLYKVRLWMSAVNPASFSPNAINQPPSGIGPGAITNFDTFRTPADYDSSYAMAYGSDPDPYGAIPPYQVGYNTYVPNFPAIPGVPNSFAPLSADATPTATSPGQWPSTASTDSLTARMAAQSQAMGQAASPLQSRPSYFQGEASRQMASGHMMSPLMNFGAGLQGQTASYSNHRSGELHSTKPPQQSNVTDSATAYNSRSQFSAQQHSFELPHSPREFTPGKSGFFNQPQHSMPSGHQR